jgi:small ligand-binding sensory domain FIST
MRWASAFTAQVDTVAAATEAAEALLGQLGPGPVDLAIAFFDSAHVPGASSLAGALKERLSPGCLLGASAHGVISSEHELESGPALTVLAARLPGVEVCPFVLVNEAWKTALDDPEEFARSTPGAAGAELVVLLADPFSFDIERCLGAFNRHATGLRLVGGMASASPRPGANALVLNDWVTHEGGVAVALKGALRVDVVVSQGCRPIGPALQVTRAEGNVVFELDGQPALERAEQVLRELSEAERACLKSGLYVGRPVRAGAKGQGDYLIRNLLGADRERGLLAVGDHVEDKERIRFHVRDARTAREDLELLLAPQEFDGRARGALLFACNGRGQSLFGEADCDIAVLQAALGGGVPVAGMFCAGEIGPVGERNLLHGHTASIAIVRPAG